MGGKSRGGLWGLEGRGEKQAEQWERRRESLREKERGESGGIKSCPISMSSLALISISISLQNLSSSSLCFCICRML